MQKSERFVLRLAIFSRFLLISLIITWRLLYPRYDSSAQLNPSCLSSSSTADELSHLKEGDRVLWPRAGAAIEGSVVWDSVYFVRIAECGYEYEQTYAFLPLLPLSISLLSRSVFAPLIPVIGYRAVLALSGYVLNNIAFVLAAIYFYKLSFLILKDSAASLQASVLFCFNPASIFYSSIYSESLYALFSFCGLFYLFSGSNYVAILLLGVSGTARSNGAIHAGYFCFKALLQAYDAITNKNSISFALQAIVGGAAYSICLFVPFAAFQVYGYYNICVCASDGLRPWCNSRVPNLYGYLQSHYWGVGFLRYFEVKQLPNFLLASPILAIAIVSVIYYASLLQQTLQSYRMASDSMTDPHGKDNCQEIIYSDNSSASVEFKAFTSCLSIWWISGITFRGNIFAFGYSQSLSKPLIYFSFIIKEYVCSETGNHKLQRRKSAFKASASEKFHYAKHEMDSFIKFKQGYCSVLVFPFILHLGFMTFIAFFVMHVQVATRFLSASPPIYWFASYVMLSPGTTSRRVGYVIWSYSIAYILLGSLLFSNFYPFT